MGKTILNTSIITLIGSNILVFLQQFNSILGDEIFNTHKYFVIYPVLFLTTLSISLLHQHSQRKQQNTSNHATRPSSISTTQASEIIEPSPQVEKTQRNEPPLITPTGVNDALTDARQLRSNAEKVNTSSIERTEFIANLITNAETMSDNLNGVSVAIRTSSSSLDDVNGSISQIGEAFSTMSHTVNGDVHSLNDIAKKIETFQNNFQDIKTITNDVSKFSKQTQLLSLNARIEATQAGQYGQGFAVVAHEIKDLSNNVSESSTTIAQITERLAEDIQTLASDIAALKTSLESFSDGARQRQEESAELQNIINRLLQTTHCNNDDIEKNLSNFMKLIEQIKEIKSNTEAAVSGSRNNMNLASKLIHFFKTEYKL